MVDFVPQQEQSKHYRLGIETILSFFAIGLTVSILLKVIFDLDNNYDPGWYHLPFAGRLGGIIPRSMFIGDEKWFEPRFDGFPLLAHTLQGWLWRITGRIQSTNLVSFLAIVSYWLFLRAYFTVPMYLSAIALFSIPLVLTHASTSFVDLLGNVGTSILVMIAYRWFNHKQLPTVSELITALIGAAIAVNTKTQLQPLVLVMLLVIGLRLAWLYWHHKSASYLLKLLPIALLATTIIFATPVKNTVLYGNPLYPIKIEVAGIVLNHKLSPEAYESGNRQLNWLTSVLEINAPVYWSPDQWATIPERNRRGGFFGAYVVFNFLLLGVFLLQELRQNRSLSRENRSRDAQVACLTAIAMSLVPLNFPQSHELRYFMYWMICLVSLNLSLVSRPQNQQLWRRYLQPKYLGLVCSIFLTIVLIKTQGIYFKPSWFTLDKYINNGVKLEYLTQIKPNQSVCLVSRHIGEDIQAAKVVALKYAFLYSSYFNPEIDYDYSIQAVLNPENCQGDNIIPSNFDNESWQVN